MHLFFYPFILLNELISIIQLFPLRIWEIDCMCWQKCNTSVWFWSSYRDRWQLLWSKNNSILPLRTNSLTHPVLPGGVQLDRCDGFCNRYYKVFFITVKHKTTLSWKLEITLTLTVLVIPHLLENKFILNIYCPLDP